MCKVVLLHSRYAFTLHVFRVCVCVVVVVVVVVGFLVCLFLFVFGLGFCLFVCFVLCCFVFLVGHIFIVIADRCYHGEVSSSSEIH